MARGRDERGGRRRGAGGRGRESGSREVLVSKRLSWLLRHGVEKEGLKLGAGGYIPVSSVLSTQRIKSLSPATNLAEIREIVASNDKQRYSLIHISKSAEISSPAGSRSETVDPVLEGTKTVVEEAEDDQDPAHWLIRANQGHSLAVESDGLLNALVAHDSEAAVGSLPGSVVVAQKTMVVVHGTRLEKWSTILKSGGLKPMTRNHVHFATGVPKALETAFGLSQQPRQQVVPELASHEEAEREAVTNTTGKRSTAEEGEGEEDEKAVQIRSGMRNSSTLLIFINLHSALEKGIKFWMSDNGVVLSEGDASGLVPVDVFERVVQKGGKLLMQDGVETTRNDT